MAKMSTDTFSLCPKMMLVRFFVGDWLVPAVMLVAVVVVVEVEMVVLSSGKRPSDWPRVRPPRPRPA